VLALTQERHAQRVAGATVTGLSRGTGRCTALRMAAVLSLLSTWPLAVVASGPGFGSLLWTLCTSAAAIVVTACLTWRPQWLAPVARLVLGSAHPPTGRL
jgi:Protein of unknown function (DUF3325)